MGEETKKMLEELSAGLTVPPPATPEALTDFPDEMFDPRIDCLDCDGQGGWAVGDCEDGVDDTCPTCGGAGWIIES